MNNELIHKFYSAFAQLDSEGMLACYHNDVTFSDPAFGTLHGTRAKAMWQMLCQNAIDLRIEFSNIISNETTGTASWQAWYVFRTSGRKVHNKIQAGFEFKEGKIVRHTDHFNLHAWAGQAMGVKGWLLGGTSFFKRQLQSQTNRMLDKFIESKK